MYHYTLQKYLGNEARIKTGLRRKQNKVKQQAHTIVLETRETRVKSIPGAREWKTPWLYVSSINTCSVHLLCAGAVLGTGYKMSTTESLSGKTHSNVH